MRTWVNDVRQKGNVVSRPLSGALNCTKGRKLGFLRDLKQFEHTQFLRSIDDVVVYALVCLGVTRVRPRSMLAVRVGAVHVHAL